MQTLLLAMVAAAAPAAEPQPGWLHKLHGWLCHHAHHRLTTAGWCHRSPVEPTDGALTLLPQHEGDLSPACLDGSPYGLYFSPSKSGKSTKWTIFIQGGGWCYDEVGCNERAGTTLGSSTKWNRTRAGCGCMNTVDDGIDEDCNCLYMPYCDGASFSGFRTATWPVPNSTDRLTFRGIKNLDAALDWAFNMGLKTATEFVLTGVSAGGLSTFLHADRVAARVKSEAPQIEKIRAAPVVGFFLDHDNFRHTTGVPNTPTWAQSNYTDRMTYIYGMQNLSFGSDGGLTKACKAKHPDHPWLCFMSPHMVDVIETPFFVFNSKYDAWQLSNIFQSFFDWNQLNWNQSSWILSNWATPAEKAGVLAYGADFMTDFAQVMADSKNGAFITSCICHGCPWPNATALSIDGKSVYNHYADWMAGRTTGKDSIHIDTRTPNGGGAIVHPQCAVF